MIDPSRHETADDYCVVIARHSCLRIILCRDGIQYIIQKRKKGGAKRPWRSLSYSTTKKALLRLCTGLNWPIGPDLERLPNNARDYGPETEAS